MYKVLSMDKQIKGTEELIKSSSKGAIAKPERSLTEYDNKIEQK